MSDLSVYSDNRRSLIKTPYNQNMCALTGRYYPALVSLNVVLGFVVLFELTIHSELLDVRPPFRMPKVYLIRKLIIASNFLRGIMSLPL